MSRDLKEQKIHERTARTRLAVRNEPYWHLIAQGFHLGYRKGTRKTSWMVRLRREETDGEGYRKEALGQADDLAPANGLDILSYRQALEKALAWKAIVESSARHKDHEATGLDPTLTLAKVVQTYIARRNSRRTAQAGRTVNSDAQYKLTAHVLEDKHLPKILLRDLTEADLIAWQGRLVAQAPASRQRIVNDLKAALNAAFAAHRRALPHDLPTVIKFGLQAETGEGIIARARENQILPDESVRAIVDAAMTLDEDFGRLVLLLAATGARFAQLRRMRVADVQAEQQRLLVPQSFKGKRRQTEFIRIAVRADVIAALRPVLVARDPSAPLLERWRLRQTRATVWVRESRGAWQTPSEMTRMWTRIIAGLKLPAATIPYALRHSSIVRGLRANLPIRLVAALHDTSVGMIERHYSRWITEGLEEMVARAAVPLWSGTKAAAMQAA